MTNLSEVFIVLFVELIENKLPFLWCDDESMFGDLNVNQTWHDLIWFFWRGTRSYRSIAKDYVVAHFVNADLTIFSANAEKIAITAPSMRCDVCIITDISLHLNDILVNLFHQVSTLNLADIKSTVWSRHHNCQIIEWVEWYLGHRLLKEGAHWGFAFCTDTTLISCHRRPLLFVG